MKTRPILQTPRPQGHENPAAEINPRRVAAMIAELPLLNARSSLRSLLGGILPTNEQQLPPRLRWRLLELYRPPALTLSGPGGAERAEQEEARRTDGGRMLRALADGYKLLVKDLLEADGRKSGAWLAAALHRALEITASTLLHAFRHHAATEPFVWLDLHQLFLLGHELGIAERTPVLERKTLDERTLLDRYRQILVTAILDPYHLAKGELDRLHELLVPLVGECTLGPAGEDLPQGCFLIDPGADSPPLSCSQVRHGAAGSWVLDPRPLLAQLQTRTRNLGRPAAGAQIPELRLVEILEARLGHPRARRSPRERRRRQAHAALGLAAARHFLGLDPASLAAAMRESSAPIEVRDLDRADAPDHTLEACTVLNSSVEGHMLAFAGRVAEQARVGQLLALFLPGPGGSGNSGSAPRPQLGEIRWLRRTREDRTEMGFRLIPGTPAAVACRSVDFDLEVATGLLLPALPALELPLRIIVEPDTLRPGQRLNLEPAEPPRAVVGEVLAEGETQVQFALHCDSA